MSAHHRPHVHLLLEAEEYLELTHELDPLLYDAVLRYE
jgi:hypothetical protein